MSNSKDKGKMKKEEEDRSEERGRDEPTQDEISVSKTWDILRFLKK